MRIWECKWEDTQWIKKLDKTGQGSTQGKKVYNLETHKERKDPCNVWREKFSNILKSSWDLRWLKIIQ